MKIVPIIAVVMSVSAGFFSCAANQDADSVKIASGIHKTIVSGLTPVLIDAVRSADQGSGSNSPILWSNGDNSITISGWIAYNPADPYGYARTYSPGCSFDFFEDSARILTVVSGITCVNITVSDRTHVEYDYSGNFNLFYKGTQYFYSLKINEIFDGGNISGVGTVTLDGREIQVSWTGGIAMMTDSIID
jgi:hypothetical protein